MSIYLFIYLFIYFSFLFSLGREGEVVVTIKDKNDNAPQCDATCGQGLTRTMEEFKGTQQLFQGAYFTRRIYIYYLGKKYRSTRHISPFITNVANLYLANKPDTYY